MAPKILIACNSRGRLLDQCLKFPVIQKNIFGVFSDLPSQSLTVAEKYAVKRFHIPDADDEQLSNKALAICTSNGIDYVISTGYTRIFRGAILDAYKGRLLNSHFSLLPAFPGRRHSDWTTAKHSPREIFERMLDFGSRITGNTIHLIDQNVDGGRPVMQSSLVIPYDEDPGDTRHRLFVQECQCLMQMIVWISCNRLILREGESPRIKGAKFDSPSFAPALEEDWIVGFNPESLVRP